ncbi:MAG TPA: hypothetical protein VK988_10125 [Acidimicrobiales bacterium]|nr:hypothetical protein [Acidimicrobiales bacterium]
MALLVLASLEANDLSSSPAISADGRYVAFTSLATNLFSIDGIPSDRPASSDVFEHDRVTGRTAMLSIDDVKGQADAPSSSPSISPDGTFTAFFSLASNFDEDTNGVGDIYVHIWQASGGGTTTSPSEASVDSTDGTAESEPSAGGACTGGNSDTVETASVSDASTSSATPHEMCIVRLVSKALAKALLENAIESQGNSACEAHIYTFGAATQIYRRSFLLQQQARSNVILLLPRCQEFSK